MQDDEFEPYFQPICKLENNRVVGHEALLRWNHPRCGLLKPVDFIKIAEDSGQIEAIDWRMFELGCPHSLPLRMLKIDQVFVRELDKGRNTSSAMVEAIPALPGDSRIFDACRCMNKATLWAFQKTLQRRFRLGQRRGGGKPPDVDRGCHD